MHRFVLGFTGSRFGMTVLQRAKLRAIVQCLVCMRGASNLVALHGDCVGADAEFNAIARDARIEREKRPCTAPPELRAETDAKAIAPPVPPMQRNRLIVADASILVACPYSEERRGGTWGTVRFAERAKLPRAIIARNGFASYFDGAEKLLGAEGAISEGRER